MSTPASRRSGTLLLALSLVLFAGLVVLAVADAGVCGQGWKPPSRGAAQACAKLLASGDLLVGPAAILFGLLGLTFSLAAYLIASRRPHPITWILFATGLMILLAVTAETYVLHGQVADPGSLPAAPPVAWLGHVLAGPVLFAPLIFFFLLFPDGRLPSRRWRLVASFATATIAGMFLVAGFHPGPMTSGGAAIANPLGIHWMKTFAQFIEIPLALSFVATLLAAAASVVVRFRRSRGEQRLQLKWFATATVALALIISTGPIFWSVGGPSWAWPTLLAIGLGAVPVSAAVAILRYRLYDIDLVINRTLVYGALTATLGLVYFGLVLILQQALSPVTEESDIAIAASTLAVAALFRPARSRVQAFIDRRFYRRKYNAAKTLEAFAARLRDEVDLDALTAELLTVVKDAMQPVHASLWLRPGVRR